MPVTCAVMTSLCLSHCQRFQREGKGGSYLVTLADSDSQRMTQEARDLDYQHDHMWHLKHDGKVYGVYLMPPVG